MRAAASSIASGNPSSRRQMAATAAALAAVRAKSGRAACARATNSCTAGAAPTASTVVAISASGSASGGTGNSCSPEMRNTARLVARTLRLGQATRRSAMSGVASSTCSRLSRTRSRCFAAECRDQRLGERAVASLAHAERCAIAEATSAGSGTAASGTKTAPSANSASAAAATASASRVLPTPPGPTSVSRRISGRRRRSVNVATSRSRPTSAVSGAGNGAAACPRRGTGASEIGSDGVRSGGGATMAALRSAIPTGVRRPSLPPWPMPSTSQARVPCEICPAPHVASRSRCSILASAVPNTACAAIMTACRWFESSCAEG